MRPAESSAVKCGDLSYRPGHCLAIYGYGRIRSMEKTTVYLPIALKSELKILAKRSKRTEAEMIREALADYLARNSVARPLPRSFGMVSDGSFNAAEDEAYLAEHWKPDW